MRQILTKAVLLAATLVLLPAFGSGERLFAPGAKLWERWQAHDPASLAVVDHGAWDSFLSRHLRERPGANLVDYAGAKANAASLNQYLATLSGVRVSTLNRDEQLAYWINLYNALTVKVVAEAWPVDSIRDIDISPGLLASGPWDAKLIRVEGIELTLNDIEHRILRPIWRDPRIHYVVNCASIGCPDLAPRAYEGATIDAAMDRAARDYVNDPRGVASAGGKVTVSRIYDWFIEDFGGNEAGVIAHLSRYAQPGLRTALAGGLDDTSYDWSVNASR